MDDLFIKSLLAAIGVSLAAGPIGSIIIWNRLAFFGDALAHSAMVAIVISVVIGIKPMLGVVAFAVIFALFVSYFQRNKNVSVDTFLAIMAHSSLAIGLVGVSLLKDVRIDTDSILFGDILNISRDSLIAIYALALVVVAVIYRLWNDLLLVTISADVARVESVDVERVRLKFMLLVSLIIALSIKVVGILLITALLVMPAVTARLFSTIPERMAVLSSIFAMLASIVGITISFEFDIITGPAIVVSALLLLFGSRLVSGFCCKIKSR